MARWRSSRPSGSCRARLRDEVPVARAGVRQARGDGRRREAGRGRPCHLKAGRRSRTHPGPCRGARPRPRRRPDGPAQLHRVLPPAAHRERADRGAALLPRPAAGRDRRARHDADERRRADDARGRPGLAAGRGRRRDPRLRARRPRHRRGSARGCSRRRVRRADATPRDVAQRSARPAASCRASATRCTAASTRAPSGSSSSPTSAACSGARRAGARAARRGRRGVGQAADDERLAADRGGDARPRLPAASR